MLLQSEHTSPVSRDRSVAVVCCFTALASRLLLHSLARGPAVAAPVVTFLLSGHRSTRIDYGSLRNESLESVILGDGSRC